MKEYIMLITGGAMAAAFAEMMAPESWKKYIRVLTGLILLVLIIEPLPQLDTQHLFSGGAELREADYTPMPQMVAEELEQMVADDIRTRISEEYGADAQASAVVSLNGEGLIQGVDSITVVTSSAKKEAIKNRLREVYGTNNVTVSGR